MMGEHLADLLMKLSSVLHWAEKYNECNAAILLSRLLRAKGIETLDALQVYVEKEEWAEQVSRKADET